MDSPNSGSLQSSSGGDDDYDSRTDSISAIMNPTAHLGSAASNPQPQPHLAATPAMFDPLSNYFDMVWSKTLRSESNSVEINPFLAASSSTQSLLRVPFASQSPTVPFPSATDQTIRPRASSPSEPTHPVRNPRKRSRASRRAPTTVLTTNTTNFRAMVQEFTGIPAPPFAASSPFSRPRLDLFGGASTIRSTPLETAPSPPFLLRPFAQRLQNPPFLSSSSSSFLSEAIASTSTNNIASGSSTNNYQQLPCELGLLNQPQSSGLVLSMQNPIQTFQSLLQNHTKYPLESDSNLKMGIFDQFGLQVNTNNTSGIQNLVSSGGMPTSTSTLSKNDRNPAEWGGGGVDSNGAGRIRYSASSSSFHGDHKASATENVGAGRGEGMVESWICSSD